MQIFLLSCLAVGGLINGIASFTHGVTPGLGVELLWIANDLTLLLGFIGLLMLQHESLGSAGKAGLVITIVSFAFIAGPAATISGIAAYSIGAPLIALSLVGYGIDSWLGQNNPRWLSGWLLISLLGSFVAGFINQWIVSVISGLLFSSALISLAMVNLRMVKREFSHLTPMPSS